jgi:hypothetical protein
MSLGYLAFVPFLVGYRGSNLYAALFAAFVLLNGLLMLLRSRGAGAPILHTPASVALRNAVLIAAVGSIFSPLMIAPALAVVTTAALLNAPMFQRPRAAVLLAGSMLAAIVVPWVAEAAGLLPSTFAFTDTGAVIHTPELGGGAVTRAVGWVTFSVLLLAAVAVIAYFVRRAERESRRRLHLHAWHLRQLVP